MSQPPQYCVHRQEGVDPLLDTIDVIHLAGVGAGAHGDHPAARTRRRPRRCRIRTVPRSLARHAARRASTTDRWVLGVYFAAVLALTAGVIGWVSFYSVTPLFTVDGYPLFYQALILLSSLSVCLLSDDYLDIRQIQRHDEYYLLLLIPTLGACARVASAHDASFFLGLETLSLSLSVLIGYLRGQDRPLEAGIKYLILSGVSSASLLFGMVILYAGLGTPSFAAVMHAPAAGTALPTPSLLAGVALILVGIGFKLSLVPFHMWAPDIYEGRPHPSGHSSRSSRNRRSARCRCASLRPRVVPRRAAHGGAGRNRGTVDAGGEPPCAPAATSSELSPTPPLHIWGTRWWRSSSAAASPSRR